MLLLRVCDEHLRVDEHALGDTAKVVEEHLAPQGARASERERLASLPDQRDLRRVERLEGGDPRSHFDHQLGEDRMIREVLLHLPQVAGSDAATDVVRLERVSALGDHVPAHGRLLVEHLDDEVLHEGRERNRVS